MSHCISSGLSLFFACQRALGARRSHDSTFRASGQKMPPAKHLCSYGKLFCHYSALKLYLLRIRANRRKGTSKCILLSAQENNICHHIFELPLFWNVWFSRFSRGSAGQRPSAIGLHDVHLSVRIRWVHLPEQADLLIGTDLNNCPGLHTAP